MSPLVCLLADIGITVVSDMTDVTDMTSCHEIVRANNLDCFEFPDTDNV